MKKWFKKVEEEETDQDRSGIEEIILEDEEDGFMGIDLEENLHLKKAAPIPINIDDIEQQRQQQQPPEQSSFEKIFSFWTSFQDGISYPLNVLFKNTVYCETSPYLAFFVIMVYIFFIV